MKRNDLMDLIIEKTAEKTGFCYAAMAQFHGVPLHHFRFNITGHTRPTAKRAAMMLDRLGIPFEKYFDAWYEEYGKPNMRFTPSKLTPHRRCQKLSRTEQKKAFGYLLSEIHKEMCRKAKDCTWRGIAKVGSDTDNAFRNYCQGKANPSFERLGEYMTLVGWPLEMQRLKLIKYGLDDGIPFLVRKRLRVKSDKTDVEALKRQVAAQLAAQKMNFA